MSQTKQLTIWQEFQAEIQNREQEISEMLPGHVSKKRFLNSAVAAVKQTPGLLKATKRSLFGAITKSAQDGLLPDGREGVITLYRDEAQWNPMTFGLRKRARELDQILVDAQVVYENDKFIWRQGDDPRLEHEPASLGTDRGGMIGAYAIFRDRERNILHREVMDKTQIEAVKGQSKAPNGLLWTKFEAEAWRKTVVRRGFKSVPCSEHLQTIVQRDDDMFAFEPDAEDKPKSQARVVQGAQGGKPLPPVVGEAQAPQTIDAEPEAASGKYEPGAHEPEESEPEKKITLTWSDGKTRQFGYNTDGALYAVDALEKAVEVNKDHWFPNASIMKHLAETFPSVQPDESTPPLKARVEALRDSVENVPMAEQMAAG